MIGSFIYNPANIDGRSHSASVCEFQSSVYTAWYCYPEKEHENGQIVLAKFNSSKKEWSKGKIIFPNLIDQSSGNPVLFVYKEILHIYFVILQDHYWDSCQVYYAKMNDDETWTIPKKVNSDIGVMVRHRPLIQQGMGILPAYCEKTMQTQLYQFSSDPTDLKLYSKLEGKYIQGDLIAHNDLEWQMFLRTAGEERFVAKALSTDSGKTWPMIMNTKLFCPLSGVAAIQLNSGNILVANNHTKLHKRTPLSLSISTSKGVSFDDQVWHIDKGDMELSYPSLLQAINGEIHLVYTFNRRMIRHFCFTEKEIFENLEKTND